jgi:hypothetical protein
MIRNLQLWASLYEAGEVPEIITSADSRQWHLADVQRLYAYSRLLPPRMRQAIMLCLYDNCLEKRAASIMGVSPTNPVAMYATVGLTRLLGKAHRHELPGIRFEFLVDGGRS